MKDNPATEGARCVIDDPEAYGGLGLPTALMPAFINSVSYDCDNAVLSTSYQRGESWKIDQHNRQINVVAADMKRPHGLHTDPLLEGYMVTDTVGERVLYVSEDLAHERVIDFANVTGKKPGLEHAGWLQYTTRIGQQLYCAALTSRQRLILFDPVERVKRDISLDPEWGVQMVVNSAQGLQGS